MVTEELGSWTCRTRRLGIGPGHMITEVMKVRKIIMACGVAVALATAGCGASAQQACTDAFGSDVQARPSGEDEAYCMRQGEPQPLGEVENGGTGYELDED